MAETPRELVSLVDRQAAARDRVAAGVLAQVQRLWRRFDAPYDDAAVRVLAEQLAGAVRSGQVATANVTDAYIAQVIAVLTSGRPQPSRVALPDAPRGVDPVSVYERPAEQYRYLVAQGMAAAEAAARAEARLLLVADDDLTLAMRHATRQSYSARDVQRYRRVIRPERSRSGTCGLCAAASDRVYTVGTLMPVHERCKCETLPLLRDNDPGRSLNSDELADLYRSAGSTGAADLKRIRVAVHEHGELGPVLRVKGQHWRGPADVAA